MYEILECKPDFNNLFQKLHQVRLNGYIKIFRYRRL